MTLPITCGDCEHHVFIGGGDGTCQWSIRGDRYGKKEVDKIFLVDPFAPPPENCPLRPGEKP